MPSLYSRGSVWCWCCWSTGSSARRALGNLIGNCVATVVVAAWGRRSRWGQGRGGSRRGRAGGCDGGLGSSPLRKRSDKALDWQGVIDRIAAEVRIVTVWLGTLVCSLCARQQCVAAGLCGRHPVVFPAPPCVPVDRVEEIALNPRGAAIEADPELGDFSVPRPCGTKDGVGAAGLDRLVHARPRDLRLQLHLRERPAHGSPIGIVPIAVV